MKSGLGLTITTSLEQKLQPRQILCNELLMLPLLDLQLAVRTELDQNIFLEAEDHQEMELLVGSPEPQQQATPPGGDEDPQNGHEDVVADANQLNSLMDYLKQSRSTLAPSGGDIPESFDFDARVSIPGTWREDLVRALRLERLEGDEMLIAEYLVENLNERGYLEVTIEDAVRATGRDPSHAERVLELLQRVAPPGVGARDLQERLLLRARALPIRSELLEKILEEAYKEVLAGRFDVLRKKFDLDEEDLRDAIELLKEIALNPILSEEGEPAASVVPDAAVVKGEDGRWIVKLHDESIPRLKLVDPAGLARRANSLSNEARDYLTKAHNRAKWMMDALEQRRRTLRRIVETVVERQVEFLDHGPDALVPLKQEDVAETLNLHASTISRAVQEKFVSTPHGVMPLKALFQRGVPSNAGVQQARGSVQDRLAELVTNEDPEHPLSDDALVDLLARANINISRRTVCKYRDELNIAPASKRKERNKLFRPGKN